MQCYRHSNTSHLTADAFAIPKILHRLLDMISYITKFPPTTSSFSTYFTSLLVKDATMVEFSSVQKELSEVPQGS